ncbi:MAG TPA: nuclear transport factor 2 family protein [Kofleriaceae bacterium]|jgi:predicted ester cyclase|nr:nuclear transport factor 2 family protein [Kofleriaceae bacterium]
MNKLAIAALVLTTSGGCFNGCQKKKEAEAIEPMPAISSQPEAAKPLTGEELAQRAIACWGFYSDSKWDDLKGCYTPDARLIEPSTLAVGAGTGISKGIDLILAGNQKSKVGVPDLRGDVRLVLVHDHDVATIAAATGTHTGPIDGITGMNQKIADLEGNVDVMDDAGREIQETDYEDTATTRHQLKPDATHPVRSAAPDVPKEIVVAKHDDAEKANVAAVQSLIDGFNKHDTKAMGAVLADDVVWSEQQNPKDWTKAEALADARSSWKSFSDMKLTADSIWGAGNYVVVQATMQGTNDAPAPEMGIKTATKKQVTLPFLEVDQLDGGKIKHAWVIANSGIVPVELGLAPMPAATGSADSAAK